jgi:hypothetical protein
LHQERATQLQEKIKSAKKELVISGDVSEKLVEMGIEGEALKETGLGFVRRDMEDGKIYFLVNHTPHAIDGFIPINYQPKTVMIMDPLTGNSGMGAIKPKGRESEVYLQMKPGASLILRTFDHIHQSAVWEYHEVKGDPVEPEGPWDLQFLSGGPEIPEGVHLDKLQSWTEINPQAEAFSGTARYRLEFDNPDPKVTHWLLDLGDVRESARVWINGQSIGCLWSVPFATVTEMLHEGSNTLEIEVTNLSANRLRDLEKRGVEWKIFYEINMVNRHYEKFDATKWDPMPSGLLGKVTLTPLGKKVPR